MQLVPRSTAQAENYLANGVEVPGEHLCSGVVSASETPAALAFRYKALMDGRATVEVLPHKDHYLATGTGAHLCAFKIRNWLNQQGQA